MISVMRSTRLPFHLAALAAACIPAIAATRPLAGQRAGAEAYRETIPGTLVSFEMVPVPEGTVDGIAVKPFYIGRTEVTWDMYDVFALGLDVREGKDRRGRRRASITALRSTRLRLGTRGLSRHQRHAGRGRSILQMAFNENGTRLSTAHRSGVDARCEPRQGQRHAFVRSARRNRLAQWQLIGTDACSRRAQA